MLISKDEISDQYTEDWMTIPQHVYCGKDEGLAITSAGRAFFESFYDIHRKTSHIKTSRQIVLRTLSIFKANEGKCS